MKVIYHVKDVLKKIVANKYQNEVLKSILLDLFGIENHLLGRRCRIEIIGITEKVDRTSYIKYGPLKIGNFTRTFYWKHGWTNVCEYKKITKEKKNDTNTNN